MWMILVQKKISQKKTREFVILSGTFHEKAWSRNLEHTVIEMLADHWKGYEKPNIGAGAVVQ